MGIDKNLANPVPLSISLILSIQFLIGSLIDSHPVIYSTNIVQMALVAVTL